jgi:hypothetical protein
VITVSSGPDWATIMTAFGTVGAVVVALGIAIWSERRTDKRLSAERTRSDEQLADERAFSRAQIAEERQIARDREQFAEAYQVQVVLGERSTGELGKRAAAPSRLGAIVINHGRYTITGVEARIRLASGGGPSLILFAGSERVPGTKDLDPRLRNGMSGLLEGLMYGDRITPWDVGLCFWSDPVPPAQVSGAYPVVRWTDRWGSRWEHRQGEVRQSRDGEEWVP